MSGEEVLGQYCGVNVWGGGTGGSTVVLVSGEEVLGAVLWC